MQCPHCFREMNTPGVCPFCGFDGTGQEKKFPLALRPGSILNGRYVLGHVLGQGGFGITYIAQDYQTKARVAIKEYFPAEFAGRTGVSVQVYSDNRAENFAYGKEQFLEEAKTLAAFIGNANIVRIYSYFEENGTAYLCMEYVDGLPLDKYMAAQGGRLSPAEADRLLLPLMEALEAVHAKGIVHRDIAPDNILVDRNDAAKLIDFGAARYSTGEKSRSLDVVLKHGFAPYEQYMRRGRQGPWTDVYALAATYYYAITGKIPPEAVDRRDDDDLIPPGTLGAKLSAAQEDVLLKALEVLAADRYQSMAEFHRAMLEASPDAREKERQLARVRGKSFVCPENEDGSDSSARILRPGTRDVDQNQNILHLGSTDACVTDEEQGAYKVQSGLIHVFVAPLKNGKPGLRRLLCEVGEGQLIPSFRYRDESYTEWRFVLIPQDEADLLVLRGQMTSVLYRRFAKNAGLESFQQEGFNRCLVDYYRRQELKDRVSLDPGASRVCGLSLDQIGVFKRNP